MEKFIPYEKLSKKEKRKIDLAKRQTWGELNPVTRKPVSSKAYNRRKSQNWKRELPPTDLRLFALCNEKIEKQSQLCYDIYTKRRRLHGQRSEFQNYTRRF